MGQERKFRVTYYCWRDNSEEFVDSVKEAFKDDLFISFDTGESTHMIQLKDQTTLEIEVDTDEASLEKDLNGMFGYFLKAPVENQQVRAGVLAQIKLFKYVGIVDLVIDGDNEQTQDIFNKIYETAEIAGAFILQTYNAEGDMRLVDSDGDTLIAKDGSTDYDSFEPMSDDDDDDYEDDEAECDVERKQRAFEICDKMNVPYVEGIGVAIPEEKCELATKEEILHRLACVTAAAACADTCCNTPNSAAEDIEYVRNTMEQRYGINEYLSDREKRYIADPLGHSQYHSTYSWRYECCWVMMWALGLVEWNMPTSPCDAHIIIQTVLRSDFDTLLEKSQMRSKEEILDKLELIFRFNWACTNARVHRQRLQANINPEVVWEWHYAFNWIARVGGITDWDKVQPNT